LKIPAKKIEGEGPDVRGRDSEAGGQLKCPGLKKERIWE
jgi:hypothetical protein